MSAQLTSRALAWRKRRRALLAAGALLLVAAGARPLLRHLRAAALLLRFVSSGPPTGLAGWDAHPVDVEETSFALGAATVPARLYRPRGVERAPGLVMIHGVHRLGRDEPRLVHFARLLAGAGLVVLTPEVRSLADYRVEPGATATIAAAARALRARLGPGTRPVGLMGLSFAGGLCLLAATEPTTAPQVGYVVAVGAHDDMARVARFFVTDEIARPDGSILRMRAHEYGALVLVYDHAEDFFPPGEVEGARQAIRRFLQYDDEVAARALAGFLGPRSRAKLDALFSHRLGEVRDEVLAMVDRRREELAAVSPHGRLGPLRVPALILHGAGDNVIPPSEALWLERDVPPSAPRQVLISQAIQHVELNGRPSVLDELALVHFLAGLLAAAEQ